MTSLFTVSDTLAALTVTVCVVFVTVGGPGAVQGNVHIRECSAYGWMELLESEFIRTVIQCYGFDANDTVEWRITTNNSKQAASTCGSYTTKHYEVCDSTTTDIFVLRYYDRLSGVTVNHNLRKLFSNARVDCFRQDYTDVSTCTANVVTDAELSDCKFTMTEDWTLAGTCNFHKAYSSNGTYTCTWTLTPSDGRIQKDVNIPGIINRTEQTIDGKLYYRGTCSFSRQLPAGNYSYKVRFFPSNYWSQSRGTVTVTGPPSTTQLSYTSALPTSTENPICTEDQPSSNNAYVTGGVITAVVLIVAAGVVVLFRKSLWRRLHDHLHQRQPPGEIPHTGLDVYETVGQPSHTTSQDRDTVQYEILDQTPVSFVSNS